MSAAPRRLLFVCTGNICRSLMAERLALKLAADRGLPLEARSAGVAAESYFTPPAEVAAALRPCGCTPEGHRPQLAGRDLLRWADVVLVMTRRQRELLLDQFPEFTGKVHLLRSFAGLDDQDVADPIGKPQAVYDACRDRLLESLEALFSRGS